MQSTSKVKVVIGAGSIGQAIARRVSAGKQVVLADLRHYAIGASQFELVLLAYLHLPQQELTPILARAARALSRWMRPVRMFSPPRPTASKSASSAMPPARW